MERIELKIYDAVSKEQKACVNKWKFQDTMMGERFITFTITSEDPIEWRIGDYCTYRDETFWLNNIPTVTQKAPVSTVQDGFTYDNVKFDSVQEELTRCMMLDVTPTTSEYVAVLGTNHTGSSRFQLYCGETTYNGKTLTPVCALALKIQANLDRLYPNKWHVYVDTETTYTTSSGKVMLATHTDDKLLSFDNTTVAAALAMVNSEFDLDFIIRSREIKIGYALNELTADDVGEMFVFGYGKGYPSADNQGKGLFQIKQMANSQQKIVTRLRALGSTKNMPYRYYNKKYGGESNPDLSQSLFPTNLQLPGTFLPEGDRTDAANAKGSTKWARNNARSEYLRAVKGDTNDSFIDKNDDADNRLEGVREDSARWDGSNSNLPEIYPTIEGTTYGELREAGVEDMDGNAGIGSFQGTSVHPDTERVDSLLAVGYTDNGVLVDDANVGDGINPEETSYSTIVRPAVIGQTKLVYRPSEHGEDLSFEGNETELFTIKSVSPGKYFMAPTGGGYTSVLFSFWLSSASVSASIGYVVRVKQRVGASTTLIAQYSSAFTSVTGTATHEIALPELPDAKDVSGGQVNDITVTQLCDIVVTFAPVVSEMQGGGFTLSYMVGRSMLHPSDDYDPEYNWGPVDGGIAANGSFHVFIKDMGFDLTTTFTGDTPVMAMKSGRCVGREFEIGENIVAASVNGVKGYLLTLNRAQDSNLGTYYPSETDPISAGDYFVLLGISMPDAYIEAAEARLLMAATDYLSDNCETKFTYQPSIDDIYLQRQHDNMAKAGTPEKSVYSRLYAGLRFSFHGIPSNGTDPLPRIDIAIQQVTITMGESLTPKVDVVLNDDVQQSTIQRLTTAVDRIYNGSAYGAGGGANLGMLYELLLTEGGKMFLSKINDDVAAGKITFRDIVTAIDLIKAKNGIAVGDFMPGFLGTGAQIWGDGSAEFESVNVRGAIRAAELVFNLISAEEGESIRSIGHGEILSVTPLLNARGTATLKLDGDEWATIAVGDICRGMYNTVNKEYDNATAEGTDHNGFRLKAGFYTSYFRITRVTSAKGSCTFDYVLQTIQAGSATSAPVYSEHPCPLMKFAVYGNTDDTKRERQSSMYISAVGIAPRLLFLAGVNTWKIKPENIKLALGNIDGISVTERITQNEFDDITQQDQDAAFVVNVNGTLYYYKYKQLSGDAGFYCEDNIYLGGIINQFTAADWDLINQYVSTEFGTTYKLLVSANAILRDGGTYMPSSISVSAQIGSTIKTAAQLEQIGNIKIRYINGTYSPSGSNTYLQQCPLFVNVQECITVVLLDLTDANSPVVLDIESVTINSKGKDGAGQPYVVTNIDQIVVDCDANGNVITPLQQDIEASIYWGDTRLKINDYEWKYGNTSEDDAPSTAIYNITKQFSFTVGTNVSSYLISVFLNGEDNVDYHEHTAQKTIPVIANRRGNTGSAGASLVFVGAWVNDGTFKWDSNIRNAVKHDGYYWLVNITTDGTINLGEPTNNNANWQNIGAMRFVATELLLAEQGEINLLSSNVINLFNVDGDKTASMNADGNGSYCIYYPQSGAKMYEFSYTKDIVCYNDDDGNSVAWRLGASGLIEKPAQPHWNYVWLYQLTLGSNAPTNNSFNGSDTFTLVKYPMYIAGDASGSGVQSENGKIYKANHDLSYGANGNHIADGWYTKYSMPWERITDIGGTQTWEIEAVHIMSGSEVERKTITTTKA